MYLCCIPRKLGGIGIFRRAQRCGFAQHLLDREHNETINEERKYNEHAY